MQSSSSRRRTLIGLSFGVLWLTPAFAQRDVESLEHDGKWVVRVQGVEGGYQSGRLVIEDFAGSWRDTSGKAAVIDKACRGKTFPITVQRTTASALEFTVWGSSVNAACPDLTVNIAAVPGKVQEGTIGAAGKIRMERPR